MDPKISQCSIVNVNDSAALPKTFTFDGVYYTDSTTEQIYNEIISENTYCTHISIKGF